MFILKAPPGKHKTEYKYNKIADDIIVQIFSGRYKTGDKLPSEAELTKQYSVSRVTLRESLKKLSMMGVLKIVQGDGTYVNEVTPADFMRPLFPLMAFEQSTIKEIYDSRMIVEGGACELAAERRTKEELLYLRELLENMEDAIKSNDKAMYSFFDQEFHSALAKYSGNSVLYMINDLFDQLIAGYIKQINVSLPTVKNSMLYHQQIYEAIKDQSPELARITMREHLRKSRDILLGKLGEQ